MYFAAFPVTLESKLGAEKELSSNLVAPAGDCNMLGHRKTCATLCAKKKKRNEITRNIAGL